ncbi:pilus assembly protein Flp/PilA [Parabacteroides sp. PF5-5]|uniref:tetratricopeptide repeat protein n=1 Tax=unclassified Parabacteroides TaxID=2649774 RepID=UPI002473D157|nr:MULTISPECIES: hypothetical protein [unclassified Parabacteroides]MDH6306937.1 pilus assembly protein Flp/PilA [Parabacteroides sp. PH5-39]MDH6317802.1 pilus assembly protein Flp/PilA [Parabacteroides sp. PF5-13]MDH6321542.1 pilus assembly protein Flp/PilA [Parabacteroides sp. PH5-13]MDH6325324.1 pilus assembly protein Flp/PilA [Parabacteroides sp. PH5-8]MDH6328995.1 pilus assembly protein Flp/PilA [Parabacteroides sp. PH5-41]
MKKVLLFVLTLFLCTGSLFAQDADQLRDEGDAALKEKNYALALTKYSEYLKLTDYQDAARIFNTGYSADQAKNYAEAVRFFGMAIEKNYNKENAYVGKVKALRDLDKKDEFIAALGEGLKDFPTNVNLGKLGYGYLMKVAQAEQKSGNIAEAEKLFKEVLVVPDKTHKGNALYSLGILFFNNGAKALQAASPLATSDPDKYAAEKAKANEDFKKAKTYLEQALVESPANENAKKSLENVNKALE